MFTFITWLWPEFSSQNPWLLFERLETKVYITRFLSRGVGGLGVSATAENDVTKMTNLIWLNTFFFGLFLFSSETFKFLIHSFTTKCFDTSPKCFIEMIIEFKISVIPCLDLGSQFRVYLNYKLMGKCYLLFSRTRSSSRISLQCQTRVTFG